MALGAAIGGILGGASSALSAAMNYNFAKKLMDKQYDLNIKSLKNSPAAARQGYVNAGYNPLLALGSQGMGFSASSSGVGADIASGATGGANSAMQALQQSSQIDNTKAQTTLVKEQAKTEEAKRIQMEFQNAMLDVEKHLKQKDLSTYDRRFYTEMYERMQHAENLKANSAIGAMNAQTNRLNAQTNRKNSAIAEYNAKTQRYKNNYSWHGASFGASWSQYSDPYYSGNSGYPLRGYITND